MNKSFNNFNWEDAPSTATPLNAANLNKINTALNTIDDRVCDTKDSAVTFSQASEDADIASGDTHATLFGKIKKRFAVLATNIAAKLDSSKVSNSRSVTEAGFALDARQGNAAVPGTMAADISSLNSALSGYLPLNGGLLNPDSNIVFRSVVSGGNTVGVWFNNNRNTASYGGIGGAFIDNVLNRLYMGVNVNPYQTGAGLCVYSDNITWKNNDILHKGNSKPLAIQSTAPQDTSVLWIDTSTMKAKIYVSGAWTALS